MQPTARRSKAVITANVRLIRLTLKRIASVGNIGRPRKGYLTHFTSVADVASDACVTIRLSVTPRHIDLGYGVAMPCWIGAHLTEHTGGELNDISPERPRCVA